MRHSPHVHNLKDTRRLKNQNKYFNVVFLKNQKQCQKFTMNKISKFDVRGGSVTLPCRDMANLEAEEKPVMILFLFKTSI